MRHYPDLSKADPANHLLFDLGFSCGLLSDVKGLLKDVTAGVYGPMQVLHAEELLEAIADLEQGRLQYRNEIYDNAYEAARRGALSMAEGQDRRQGKQEGQREPPAG